jgi:hypothetical protein
MALESGINSFRTVRLAALVANQIKGLIVDGYLDDAAGRKLVMPNGQQRHSGPPWKSPPRTLGTVGFGPKTANSCRFPFYARESIAFSADKRDRKKHSLLEGLVLRPRRRARNVAAGRDDTELRRALRFPAAA